MIASENGDKEVVKLLLDHGADINMQIRVSVTDMIYMRDVYVMYVYVCVYECMINFIYVCLIDCMYIFIIVIMVIIILISNIICIVYQYGYTALMVASRNGHKEVVKLLLDHGADINMQDNVSVIDMIYMSDMSVCICMYIGLSDQFYISLSVS